MIHVPGIRSKLRRVTMVRHLVFARTARPSQADLPTDPTPHSSVRTCLIVTDRDR